MTHNHGGIFRKANYLQVQPTRSLTRRLAVAVAASAFLLASSAFAAAPAVWGAHGTVKVQPAAPVEALSTVRLQAARNEFEPFQVVVHGGDAGLSGVSAQASALSGPNGHSIAASNLSLFRVDYLNVTQPSGGIGTTGTWPDALVPAVDEIDGQARSAFPFNVEANRSRSIWIDVFVPPGTAPGVYSGQVTVTASGFSASVPVELEVWGFDLPSTASLASAFLLYMPTVCSAHTGSGSCGGNAQAAELAAKYQRLALDHRLTLCNAHSQLGGDFANLDKYFGPLMDGTGQTRLAGAKMTSLQYTGAVSADAYKSFAEHARAKGWMPRVFDYTGDEPPATPWSTISSRADVAHQGAPDIRTLVTTGIDDASSNGVLGKLDILTPVINFMEDGARASYDGFVSSGKTLWMYQSCMSHGCGGDSMSERWPSYMADVSAMRNRMMQWADFKLKVTGELYYETAMAYHADPWNSIFEFNGNGDGTFFYPGTPAKVGGSSQIPVASIRLKMLREGMEDFEYLTLLEKLGDGAKAHAVTRSLLPSSNQVPDDPAPLYAARQELAARIVELAPAAWVGTPGTGGDGAGAGEPSGGGDSGGLGCSSAGGLATGAWLLLPGLGLALRRRRAR